MDVPWRLVRSLVTCVMVKVRSDHSWFSYRIRMHLGRLGVDRRPMIFGVNRIGVFYNLTENAAQWAAVHPVILEVSLSMFLERSKRDASNFSC